MPHCISFMSRPDRHWVSLSGLENACRRHWNQSGHTTFGGGQISSSCKCDTIGHDHILATTADTSLVTFVHDTGYKRWQWSQSCCPAKSQQEFVTPWSTNLTQCCFKNIFQDILKFFFKYSLSVSYLLFQVGSVSHNLWRYLGSRGPASLTRSSCVCWRRPTPVLSSCLQTRMTSGKNTHEFDCERFNLNWS